MTFPFAPDGKTCKRPISSGAFFLRSGAGTLRALAGLKW